MICLIKLDYLGGPHFCCSKGFYKDINTVSGIRKMVRVQHRFKSCKFN